MKRLLRVLGLFCFIFNPPIISFNIIHILAFMALAYIFTSPDARKLLSEIYNKSKGLLLAYIICGCVCVLYGKTQTLLNFFAVLAEIIPISAVVVTIYKQHYRELLKDIVWAGCLQASISLVAFLFPPLQAVIVARMISVGYSDVFQTMAGWRMFGLSRELTFAMPITQSLIACICLYFALIDNKNFFIPVPFLFFSSFINARTGLVVFSLGAFIIVLSVLRFKLESVFKLFFVGIIVVVALSLFSSLLSRNELTSDWLMSGIDDFSSFARGEELDEKGSYFITVTDANKYKLPESIDQLLLGTGERLQGGKSRYKTDIGFINDIWMGGLVYLFLVWRFFLYNTVKIIEGDAYSRKVKNVKLLAYGVAFVLLITNIKGQVFTWNEFINFWFVLFAIYISKLIRNRLLCE